MSDEPQEETQQETPPPPPYWPVDPSYNRPDTEDE